MNKAVKKKKGSPSDPRTQGGLKSISQLMPDCLTSFCFIWGMLSVYSGAMICDGAKWGKGNLYKPEDICINSLRTEINPCTMNLAKKDVEWKTPNIQQCTLCDSIHIMFRNGPILNIIWVWRSAEWCLWWRTDWETGENLLWGKKNAPQLDPGGSHMSGYTEICTIELDTEDCTFYWI